MNGLLLLGLSALILVVAYLFYGRYLVKTWGIDPKATTPAVAKEDGTDFVPTNKWSVFAHQFSSIAGAGPVTGPVMAMMFGWLPAFLWVIVGGVFFGAVQDFGALYASVKTEGKSMGQIIEKYIGRKGKKLFFLFCWIFTLIVIAAFADMVAGTFNGISADGAKLAPNASAASISILYVFVAMAFGLFLKKVKLEGLPKVILGIALIIAMLALGIMFPVYATKTTWIYVVFVYIFFASVTPMWLLKTPRDYLTTFLFIGMIVAAVILSGTLPNLAAFQDAAGNVRGIRVFREVTLGFPSIIEVAIILLAALLSFKTTDSQIRTSNHFTWGAIKEVAVLFIGIFITMQPALMLLKSMGPELGLSKPLEMFWATGALSSFLDNTPTYLVFLTTAGTLGFTQGIATTVGTIPVKMLTAISCGAVFMGANTYIGNAPNFMVKSISDENGVRMPSFFGYLLWSIVSLVPVFIIDTLVFFL